MFSPANGYTSGLLLQFMDAIRGDIQAELTDSCSFMHIKALDFISHAKSPSMRDVAEFLKITSPGATMVVDKLVENGELDRLPDQEDRRVIRLAITTMGKETLDGGMKIVRKLLTKRIESLSKVDQKNLGSILRKLIK